MKALKIKTNDKSDVICEENITKFRNFDNQNSL